MTSPSVTADPATEPPGDRQAALAAALASLRRRAGTGLGTEDRLALGGGALLVGGAVLVLLAWYGAAHTSRVYLQIPYLISGGLLGVVLAFAGGSLYFTSWVTRLVHEERARADAAEATAAAAAETLARIEVLLAASLPSGPRAGAEAGPAAGNGDLVVTPNGRLAHRPDCPTVAGRPHLRSVGPDLDGLAACRMCEPLG